MHALQTSVKDTTEFGCLTIRGDFNALEALNWLRIIFWDAPVNEAAIACYENYQSGSVVVVNCLENVINISSNSVGSLTILIDKLCSIAASNDKSIFHELKSPSRKLISRLKGRLGNLEASNWCDYVVKLGKLRFTDNSKLDDWFLAARKGTSTIEPTRLDPLERCCV
jgi:hypothetical protein